MKAKDHKNIPDKVHQTIQQKTISFGFGKITDNKSFGLSGMDKNNKIVIYDSLVARLKELSKIDIHEAKTIGKKLGLEKIEYKQFSQPFQKLCDNIDIITKDSKLFVFQFGNHKYRMICKDDLNNPNFLHIIAFDWKFKAYNH